MKRRRDGPLAFETIWEKGSLPQVNEDTFLQIVPRASDLFLQIVLYARDSFLQIISNARDQFSPGHFKTVFMTQSARGYYRHSD
jgi:hypothetical protein